MIVGSLHDGSCKSADECVCNPLYIAKPTPQKCSCGHSDRMHVTGVSPRYAGCMVVVEAATEHRRRRYCSCSRTPAEAIRDAVGLA